MRTRITLFCTLAVTVTLAACNVFEGLYEEGTSNDPKVLLTDARAAMQDGRVDDAVTHLTKAHDKQPKNVEVRVELASALLTQHKIDIMLISDLVDQIDAGSQGEGASKQANCSDESSCHFDCSVAKSSTPFSYKDSEAYLQLEEAIAVLEQVDVLVNVPLAELGAEPGHRYDIEADRKALFEALVTMIDETNPDENPRRIAVSLLLDAGITSLSTTLTNLEQSADELDITLYHVERNDGAKYVSYCGQDVEAFVAGTMCPARSSAFYTLDMLETRRENFASSSGSETSSMAAELVDAGHELFDGMNAEIEADCGAGGV